MDNSPLRILLVDDDRSLLDILGTILELDGHGVVKAASAHEGLLTMREQEYDLVLVDLKMPRTTGLDMLRAIREDSPETKVVIMTAYASVNSTVEAMRLGVFDYLPKPFKLADLRTILQRVRREKVEAGKSAPEDGKSAPGNGGLLAASSAEGETEKGTAE